MTTVKTYGWLGPERLKFISENPKVLSLLYDLGLLPEEISTRVRGYVEDEQERCAKIADSEPWPEGPAPAEVLAASAGLTYEQIIEATVKATRESIAEKIRRSQDSSKEQKETSK